MVAIYVRQSLDKKDSLSIDTQIQFCERQIGEDEQRTVYCDKGYSGSNTKRPGFKDMMRNIKSGIITKVVVYKLDRISRSLLDFAQIVQIFNQYDVAFVSCSEKFNTSSAIGKAMLSVIMVFAQLERETLQTRVTDNYYARGRQGLYLGGSAPYGFQKVPVQHNDKKTYAYKPVDEQVKVLQEMFHAYAYEGTSLGQISKSLNERGIQTTRGVNWDSCKVGRRLANPAYVKADVDVYQFYKNQGCTVYNDVSEFVGERGCYLFGNHDGKLRKLSDLNSMFLSLALHYGIVDSRTFLQCQERLLKNRQVQSVKQARTWLTGILRCGYCGASMITKGKFLYCTGKSTRQDCDGFSSTSPRLSDIESSVIAQLREKIGDKNVALSNQKQNNVNIKNESIAKLSKIEEQINNLLEGLASGNTVASKYINDKVNEMNKEKQFLETKLSQLEANQLQKAELFQLVDIVNSWDTFDIAQKKQFIRTFISHIEITETNISIVWVDKFLLL